MFDIEESQPALLAERETDHAAEFDELGLAKLPMEPFPERVIGVEMPDDCLCISQRRFLTLVVFR